MVDFHQLQITRHVENPPREFQSYCHPRARRGRIQVLRVSCVLAASPQCFLARYQSEALDDSLLKSGSLSQPNKAGSLGERESDIRSYSSHGEATQSHSALWRSCVLALPALSWQWVAELKSA